MRRGLVAESTGTRVQFWAPTPQFINHLYQDPTPPSGTQVVHRRASRQNTHTYSFESWNKWSLLPDLMDNRAHIWEREEKRLMRSWWNEVKTIQAPLEKALIGQSRRIWVSKGIDVEWWYGGLNRYAPSHTERETYAFECLTYRE